MTNIYTQIIDILMYYRSGSNDVLNESIEKILKYNSIELPPNDKWKKYKIIEILRTVGIIEIYKKNGKDYWKILDNSLIRLDKKSFALFGDTHFINDFLSKTRLHQEDISLFDLMIDANCTFSLKFIRIFIEDEHSDILHKFDCQVFDDNYKLLWKHLPNIVDIAKKCPEVNPYMLTKCESLKQFDFDKNFFKEVDLKKIDRSGLFAMSVKYGPQRCIVVDKRNGTLAYEVINDDWKVFLAYYFLNMNYLINYNSKKNQLIINSSDFRVMPYLIRRSLLYLDIKSLSIINEKYYFNNVPQNIINSLMKKNTFLSLGGVSE